MLPAVLLPDFRDWDDAYSNVGGLYAFLGSDLRVVYIGQTGRLRTRIETHLKSAKFAAEIEYVIVYPMEARQSRLLLEAQLILKYLPEHNRAIMLGLGGDGFGGGGAWEIRWSKKSS